MSKNNPLRVYKSEKNFAWRVLNPIFGGLRFANPLYEMEIPTAHGLALQLQV